MELKAELNKLSVQIIERKNHIENEEMTKQALIIPFLQKLGYDVFNPLEVYPEYTADFGIKKGEKVDYAIFKNNEPIILIEAKSVNEKLQKHDAQLSRYFNALPNVKVGILTNGIEYKFYTDLNQDNIMDSDPFYVINFGTLTNVDIETLEHFTKDKFDAAKLVKFAEELVYMSNLNTTLKELFKNPSDDFLRFLIKDFSSTRITNNVLDRFRPIVKKAINHTLLEIISEGLSPKEQNESIEIENNKQESVENEKTEESIDDDKKVYKRAIVTTEEELKAFDIVHNILLSAERDISNLKYKDTTGYFNIYNRVITKWFMKINLDAQRKYVVTRIDHEVCSKILPDFEIEEAPKSLGASRIYIGSIEQLQEMSNLIITCFDESF